MFVICYTKIAVPVDLSHTDKLNKALTTAADLAKHYHASIYLLAVTSSAPGEVAHNPVEFHQKLSQFAAAQSTAMGVEFKTRDAVTPDPAIALACMALDKDEIVLVTPSDHLIKDEVAYKKVLDVAQALAKEESLVTFGITPTFPETGNPHSSHLRLLLNLFACFCCDLQSSDMAIFTAILL